LKKIRVFKEREVTVRPFVPRSFTQNEEFLSSIRQLEVLRSKNSKQMIRRMAEQNGLAYSEEHIRFAKKILHIIVNEISNEQ
jgi:hypothetical protein